MLAQPLIARPPAGLLSSPGLGVSVCGMKGMNEMMVRSSHRSLNKLHKEEALPEVVQLVR